MVNEWDESENFATLFPDMLLVPDLDHRSTLAFEEVSDPLHDVPIPDIVPDVFESSNGTTPFSSAGPDMLALDLPIVGGVESGITLDEYIPINPVVSSTPLQDALAQDGRDFASLQGSLSFDPPQKSLSPKQKPLDIPFSGGASNLPMTPISNGSYDVSNINNETVKPFLGINNENAVAAPISTPVFDETRDNLDNVDNDLHLGNVPTGDDNVSVRPHHSSQYMPAGNVGPILDSVKCLQNATASVKGNIMLGDEILPPFDSFPYEPTEPIHVKPQTRTPDIFPRVYPPLSTNNNQQNSIDKPQIIIDLEAIMANPNINIEPSNNGNSVVALKESLCNEVSASVSKREPRVGAKGRRKHKQKDGGQIRKSTRNRNRQGTASNSSKVNSQREKKDGGQIRKSTRNRNGVGTGSAPSNFTRHGLDQVQNSRGKQKDDGQNRKSPGNPIGEGTGSNVTQHGLDEVPNPRRKQKNGGQSRKSSGNRNNRQGTASNVTQHGLVHVQNPQPCAPVSPKFARTRSGAIYKQENIVVPTHADSYHSDMNDEDACTSLSVQSTPPRPFNPDVPIFNSYLRQEPEEYLDRTYATYDMKRLTRRRDGGTSKIQISASGMKRKRHADDQVDDPDSKRLYTERSMSAKEKRRIRAERNRLSAMKSRERYQKRHTVLERELYYQRIENRARKCGVEMYTEFLKQMSEQLEKNIELKKMKVKCSTFYDHSECIVDDVIDECGWTFRPKGTPLICLKYKGKSKQS